MSALKDDFLATLSHELRTPLSAIMGWVHILRRGLGTPQDLQKGLDTIERNTRLQVQLIDDLLDMNRIASGKVRLDVQPVEPIMFIAIVKSLVELHGGSVSVSSPGEGLGASFRVCLPAPFARDHGERPPEDQAAIRLTAAYDAIDLSGLTILVVDDDADGRELARRVLGECKAKVLTAGSAAEALSLIESHRPDALVSDIGMPDMDGFSLLRSIRNLGEARGGGLPAVALTAFARPEDRAQALRVGFAAHLTKPVEPPELLATVAHVAGRTALA